jgi:hypothetical protein
VSTSGSISFLPGLTTRTINVSIIGDAVDEPDETFFVNLTSATNAFIKKSQGGGTIIDDDGPAISINDITVTEGNTGSFNANFNVSLSSASPQVITVNYATANLTATAGSDYTATSGTLTFPVGTTSRTLSVVVLGDTLNEANESFFMNLSGAVNAAISKGQGRATVIDNDPLPSLTINDVSLTEGNSGTKNFTFTVTLTPVSGRAVTVQYATVNGTATSATDYVSTSGTLAFNAGSTTQTITVGVRGDTPVEPNETFFVNVSGASNATIADSQGAGTILNDD